MKENMPDNVSLILGFNGKALENHEIDVRELAPALMSFAEMVEESDKILNKGKHRIDIKVQAFSPGSFEVVLQVIGSFKDQLVNMFDSPTTNAMLNLVETIGLAKAASDSIGLIPLIKQMSGKKITKQNQLDDATIELTLDDGNKIKTSNGTLELYRSRKVRMAVRGLVKPLDNNSIESITTRLLEQIEKENGEDNSITTIKKEDVKKYDVVDDNPDEELSDNIRETFLQLVTVQMQSGKWRFSVGDDVFFAEIEDQEFLDSVRNGVEQFAANDIMKVELREKQVLGDNGIKTERTIVKVLSHRPAEKQMTLPFSNT